MQNKQSTVDTLGIDNFVALNHPESYWLNNPIFKIELPV